MHEVGPRVGHRADGAHKRRLVGARVRLLLPHVLLLGLHVAAVDRALEGAAFDAAVREEVTGLGLRRHDNPHKTAAAVDGLLERHRPPAAGAPLGAGLLRALGKEGVTGTFDGRLPLVLVHALPFRLIIRRLLALLPTLIFTSIIVFASIRMIPGDVIDLMLAQNDISTGNDRAMIEAALGLDKPIYIQYFVWMMDVLSGDLGRSLWQNTPVTEQLALTLPITFELGFLALLVALSVAIPIGIYSAMRQDSMGDYITRSFSLLMLAVPSFWLATLVMVFPSVWWRWAPPLQYTPFLEDPVANLAHMSVPAILLGLSLSAVTMRMTRTMMLEVLRQDYIRTARAKGLKESVVIIRHALRNCLIPVVTLVGLQAPLLIGGAVILEQIFVIPGMGLMLLEAVFQRDYPVVTGVFLVVGVSILLINLVVDLTYSLLDPKVRS